MIRRIGILSLCVVTLCLTSACRKLPSRPQQLLKIEPIKSTVAIPTEYGSLVGVTSSSPTLALLWFERPDKTIVLVGVTLASRSAGLADQVVLIPRN